MSTETATKIGGFAAHDFRNIHPTGNRQIRPAAGFRIIHLQKIPFLNNDTGPAGKGPAIQPGIRVSSGNRNLGIAQKLGSKPAPGDLNTGFSIAIAGQNIGDSKGLKIHGAGNRNPAVLIPEPSAVLDHGQRPGFKDANSFHIHLP
jgi:hypothetical protein